MKEGTEIKAKDYTLHVGLGSFGVGFIIQFISTVGYEPKANSAEFYKEIAEIFLYGLVTSVIVTLLFLIVLRLRKKK